MSAPSAARLLKRLRLELIEAGCPEHDSSASADVLPLAPRRDAEYVAEYISQIVERFAEGAKRPDKLKVDRKKLKRLSDTVARCREQLEELDRDSLLALQVERSTRKLESFLDIQFREGLVRELAEFEQAAARAAKVDNHQLPPANIQMFADCADAWRWGTGRWPTLTKDPTSHSSNEPTHPLFHCVVDFSKLFGAPTSAVSSRVFFDGIKLAKHLQGRPHSGRRRGLFGGGLSRLGAATAWEAERKKENRESKNRKSKKG